MPDILMSVDNPRGHKLEELLVKVRDEVAYKNRKIEYDERPVAQQVLHNNRRIITLLSLAVDLQNDSVAALNKLAKDQGPLGKPRIGIGSD